MPDTYTGLSFFITRCAHQADACGEENGAQYGEYDDALYVPVPAGALYHADACVQEADDTEHREDYAQSSFFHNKVNDLLQGCKKRSKVLKVANGPQKG